MAFPTVALPNVQNPVPPAQAAVLTTAPSDAAIGRLPVFAVPASVDLPEAHNNTHGGGNPFFRSESPAAAQATTLPLPTGTLSSPPLARGPSAAFLAQLFGQATADGGAASTRVSERINIFDRDTIANFSNVKYLPSEAAKPRFSSPPTQPFAAVQQQQATANAQSAVQRATQAQQQEVRQEITAPSVTTSAQRASQQAVVVSPTVSGNITQRSVSGSSVTETPKPRANDSSAEPLTVNQGINAYLATLSRNTANLNSPSTPPVDAIVL